MRIGISALPMDLSDYNSPVTGIFEQPRTAQEWEKYILTVDQVKFFEDNGFVNHIQVLTEGQVDILNEELLKLQSLSDAENKLFYHVEHNESEDPDKVLFHAIGAWRITPGFHDLVWAPAFRMAAYQLLGHPLRLFHDQLFCK